MGITVIIGFLWCVVCIPTWMLHSIGLWLLVQVQDGEGHQVGGRGKPCLASMVDASAPNCALLCIEVKPQFVKLVHVDILFVLMRYNEM